jgi:N utilization substance protein A
MGQRVRNVVAELHGEKIDIIDYAEDPATFVGNALSPAIAREVTVVDPVAKAARVVVPDYQLSLAIGREGQNARLAARLTGWRIDIHSDAEASAPPAMSSAEAQAATEDDQWDPEPDIDIHPIGSHASDSVAAVDNAFRVGE